MKKCVATRLAPAAIGPYSQAVLAGNFMYVSGQLPIDPATGAFAADEIAGQTWQSLTNIKAILHECGYDLSDVVKVNVFLKNIDDFAAVNAVYADFFRSDCPARAAVEVSNLPKGALIEIEAVAYKD
jgi:2-iminobutanoate/2-iminopropanoate deaminase